MGAAGVGRGQRSMVGGGGGSAVGGNREGTGRKKRKFGTLARAKIFQQEKCAKPPCTSPTTPNSPFYHMHMYMVSPCVEAAAVFQTMGMMYVSEGADGNGGRIG